MLSVIISVYNVKPFIKECITSVLQTRIPLEVIVVHDKLKDNSFVGDEDYLQDKRITILNRANAGLGMARNQGMEVAKGDYVFFLDGDDKVFPEKLEQLYSEGINKRPDIIAGDYDDEGKIIECIPLPDAPFTMHGGDFLV